MQKTITLFILITFIYGCSHLAQLSTAKKTYKSNPNNSSKIANDYFWYNYHQGNYDSIPEIINKLNIALADNPNDLISTTHLGFVHVWALAERQRLAIPQADITEHIILSHKYFDEAHLMNPHDLRVLGFLADLTLAEGVTYNNKRQQVDGYFTGLKSIRKWPQFNKFTLGYFFSNLDTTDKNYSKGLEWQYQTIDDCACEKGTRKTNYKDAVAKIKNSKDPKIYRACWNSWIAPHNWEGFCLNWGDMLVKNGELTEAIKIYNLAKESDSYNEWPYKNELEKRINNVNTNAIAFNQKIDETNIQQQQVIMFNSKMACTGCHQMSANEFKNMGNKELGDDIYFIQKPF